MASIVTVNETGDETRGDAFIQTEPVKKPTILGREPVMFLGVIQAGIAAAVLFGFNLTPEQIFSVIGLSAAILAFIARSAVTPVEAPRLPVVSATPGQK